MRPLFLLLWLIPCPPLPAESIGPIAAEAEAWLEAEHPDVSMVNEGALEFFSTPPPGGPFHHHQNRLTITPESLATGWVAVEQCHDHLDPVPRTEITFRRGRARNISITEASRIEKARVEDDSVQLEGVSTGARLCLRVGLKLVNRSADGSLVLRSGPYMRRFLDGYYPMRVSLSLIPKGLSADIDLISPQLAQGLNVEKSGDEMHIEALFAGRLLLEFELIGPRPN